MKLDIPERDGWMRGPWDDEPDALVWFDRRTNYPCFLVRGSLGSLTGYVAVTPEHPAFGWGMRDSQPCKESDELRVHGGVTFIGYLDEGLYPFAQVPLNWIWFGFDCAHSRDILPAMTPAHVAWCNGFKYRTVTYVKRECARLAKQLAEVASRG